MLMEYKLNIANGLRAIFLFPIYFLIILFSLMLCTHIDNLILKWILVLGIIFLVGLFFFKMIAGKLLTIIDNDNLTFKWIKRPLFTYNRERIIQIDKIKRIVIDESCIVRKIYCKNGKIRLNTLRPSKISKDDVGKFVKFLRTIENENKNIRIIDSWDEWFERGYLKIAYWINTSILIIGGLLIAYAFFRKGFHPIHLIYLIFAISQLLIYQMTIKSKIKKTN